MGGYPIAPDDRRRTGDMLPLWRMTSRNVLKKGFRDEKVDSSYNYTDSSVFC
jgi:hypothetical protein